MCTAARKEKTTEKTTEKNQPKKKTTTKKNKKIKLFFKIQIDNVTINLE